MVFIQQILKLDATAVKYDALTYFDVIQQGLQVMDSTASTLCMDNDIPLIVFSLMNKGNIKRAVLGEKIGTIVRRNAIMAKQVLDQAKDKMKKSISAFLS